jgi:ferrous iron transport protein B
VRRDFGAAGFFTMNLTSAQLLVAMITITLFVPCIASAMVILKERGTRYFIGLFVGSITLAFFVGGIVWRILQLVGAA